MIELRLVCLLLIIGLMVASSIEAQDPTLPDSVIVEHALADIGDTLVIVNILAVTDDPVAFYNLPLTFAAPLGGFSLDSVYASSEPPILTLWDEVYYDYVGEAGFIRMFGIWDTGGDDNPPLDTGHERAVILNLVFRVEQGTPDQYVTIEATTDPVGGPLQFGLMDGLTGFAPDFVAGVIRYGNPTGIGSEDNVLPDLLLLKQNYPNPFNSRAVMEFSLPGRASITLLIYNLLGQRVSKLADGIHDAGDHVVVWDGKNDAGDDVPSGVYFCRLSAGTDSQTIKMLLIR